MKSLFHKWSIRFSMSVVQTRQRGAVTTEGEHRMGACASRANVEFLQTGQIGAECMECGICNL